MPGARLSYKQQDAVQLCGFLPHGALLPARYPVLQTGVGGIDTRTRHHDAPADSFRTPVYETGRGGSIPAWGFPSVSPMAFGIWSPKPECGCSIHPEITMRD